MLNPLIERNFTDTLFLAYLPRLKTINRKLDVSKDPRIENQSDHCQYMEVLLTLGD